MNFPQLYIWLSVGIVLLIIEMLGFTGFFLGMAAAAFVTAAYVWLAAPAELWPGIWVFAPLAVLFSWGYWRFFRDFNSVTDAPELNHRKAKLVGKNFELTQDVNINPAGYFLGDTRWQVASSGETITTGTTVVVQSIRDDGVLILAAI
jgi:membrane protein implicated in regulation of membrane protease activity